MDPHARRKRPFRVPFSPVLPLLSALARLYLSVETWLRFLAWLALGAVIYLGYGRRRYRLARLGRAAGGDDARPAPVVPRQPTGGA
ncbi:amino acid permease C-terminal domain-containing protein [Plantactinospora sp. CA-290183]|uniref:amino acid permease C-terminal domain-containing protein n=1 Tax=Plantactinospora sp. CA-290183 TaxID=3240006 RepID=UPI003D8DC103